MRGRWQLFTSNLIVFSLWYVLIYILTAGLVGALGALGGALLALAAGLIAGGIVGAAAHAIDLHLTHRGVRAGDAHDGARITLGKLPERAVPRPDSPSPAAAETPPRDPAPVPELAPVARASQGPTEAVAPTLSAPAAPGRLLIECAAFAGTHEGVLVAPDADLGGAIGHIYHDAAPGDFAAFLELVGRLSAEGVDVSVVRVTQDGDGVPSVVTFPVFPGDKGEKK